VDIRAQQAREHHRESEGASGLAARHRAQRDALIRQLRAEDPKRWTYPALASAVGCSPELVAYIIKH
jgi:AraC-like DNA-binding protein